MIQLICGTGRCRFNLRAISKGSFWLMLYTLEMPFTLRLYRFYLFSIDLTHRFIALFLYIMWHVLKLCSSILFLLFLTSDHLFLFFVVYTMVYTLYTVRLFLMHYFLWTAALIIKVNIVTKLSSSIWSFSLASKSRLQEPSHSQRDYLHIICSCFWMVSDTAALRVWTVLRIKNKNRWRVLASFSPGL